MQAAQTIKDRIHRELGFTVNIGIAPNRLLAKMASDFEKPDKIHVLTQDMVPQKLWPLPVGNLFGVGPKSVKRMHEIGIYTIGDLANADADILRGVFGVRGQVFRDYANGIESEPMTRSEVKDNSYGNSVTTPQDLKRPWRPMPPCWRCVNPLPGGCGWTARPHGSSRCSWWITPSAAAATR